MMLGHAALTSSLPGGGDGGSAPGSSASPMGMARDRSLDGSAETEEEALRKRQRELSLCSLELLASRMGYRDRADYLAFHMEVQVWARSHMILLTLACCYLS